MPEGKHDGFNVNHVIEDFNVWLVVDTIAPFNAHIP